MRRRAKSPAWTASRVPRRRRSGRLADCRDQPFEDFRHAPCMRDDPHRDDPPRDPPRARLLRSLIEPDLGTGSRGAHLFVVERAIARKLQLAPKSKLRLGRDDLLDSGEVRPRRPNPRLSLRGGRGRVPFAMEAAAYKRLYPHEYYEKFVSEGARPDGRPLDARPVSVARGVVSTADGSTLAKIGRALHRARGGQARVRDLVPDARAPDEGGLDVTVEPSDVFRRRATQGARARRRRTARAASRTSCATRRLWIRSGCALTRAGSGWRAALTASDESDHDAPPRGRRVPARTPRRPRRGARAADDRVRRHAQAQRGALEPRGRRATTAPRAPSPWSPRRP